MKGTYASYLQAVAQADVSGAADVLEGALDRGVAGRRLMRDVIGRGQRQVGELWMAGTWSVADEHAATAVAEQSLTIVARAGRPQRTDRHVVLACAEGEWHSFPARLAGELARTPSLDVTLLGGSVPAADLQRRLQSKRPDVLAVSATMPSNLIGAARSISAGHAEGLSVVVGGRAWGRGQHRARRLGADAHVEDPADLPAVIDALPPEPPYVAPSEVDHEALLLDSPAPEVLMVAFERQAAASPWLRTLSAAGRADTVSDLRWLTRYAAASLACDDPTILRDLLDWLTALLGPRGVPLAAIYDSCFYLADAVEREAPAGAALLRAEATLAHERRSSVVGTEA